MKNDWHRKSQEELIEEINILGPWVHGYFDLGNGIIIEDSDEFQKERLFHLKDELIKIMSDYYEENRSKEKKYTICDVGCNTGYFIFELNKKFIFKKVIGLEPKIKNLEKAKFIRDWFKIDHNQFWLQEYDLVEPAVQLNADIVLCLGVLHHLDDLFKACQNLYNLTTDLLILESMTLPAEIETSALADSLELKDNFYKDKTKVNNSIFGALGLKVEGSHLDGATNKSGVVTIPTVSALKMILKHVGFKDIEVISYKDNEVVGHRNMNTVLLKASKTKDKNLIAEIDTITRQNQCIEVDSLLDEEVIESIFKDKECKNRKKLSLCNEILFLKKNKFITNEDSQRIEKIVGQRKLEMYLGLRFQFKTKIAYEYAKILVKNKNYHEAKLILHDLLKKVNLDWRVCYRSLYTLGKIYLAEDNRDLAREYLQKCLKAYPEFFIAKEALELLNEKV